MAENSGKAGLDFMILDEEDLRKFAVKYGIKDVDEDLLTELSNVRRPLILFRGKSITVDQTI